MLWLLSAFLMLNAGQTSQPRAAVAEAAPEVEAHVGKGYEFEKDERFSKAAGEFQAALALAPGLERVRYQLGVCYFALGRNQDARREFERLRGEPHSGPSVLYFLGRLDLAERDFDGAIREFQGIVQRPPFPDTAYYLAAAYQEKGDLAASENWLKRAEPLNPRDFRIPDHLARIYQREGRTADAEKEYARAGELREKYNRAAKEGIACSHALESAAADEAQHACERLFQAGDPDRLTLLGIIYGQHGHYAEAVEPLQRASKLDPDSYEIQHDLGLTLFRLKRYDEARAPLERAVDLRPDFFDSSALLGAALFMLKDDPKAYQVLHHAHQLAPQDRNVTELLFKTASALGVASFAARNYIDAMRYLRESETLKPENRQIHAQLAELYRRTGDQHRADMETQILNQLPNPSQRGNDAP